MSRKSKGINGEREIIKFFNQTGKWCACRVAGSGSSRYLSPDIIAGNILRKLAIECKTTKERTKYIEKADVEQLLNFSSIFGAEPWLAVRFDRIGWYFLPPSDIERSGECYVVREETVRHTGIIFDELIK
ncbi:hypothetical protein J4401_00335 [Candidatus Woesearchaeota archaeon]|nr:hypothetical protein [Candidatus Woesearchaeota archaeon]